MRTVLIISILSIGFAFNSYGQGYFSLALSKAPSAEEKAYIEHKDALFKTLEDSEDIDSLVKNLEELKKSGVDLDMKVIHSRYTLQPKTQTFLYHYASMCMPLRVLALRLAGASKSLIDAIMARRYFQEKKNEHSVINKRNHRPSMGSYPRRLDLRVLREMTEKDNEILENVKLRCDLTAKILSFEDSELEKIPFTLFAQLKLNQERSNEELRINNNLLTEDDVFGSGHSDSNDQVRSR